MSTNELSEQPGFLIRRLQQVYAVLFNEALGAAAITYAQYTVLTALTQTEGLTQNEIAALTHLDTSTTADVVRRLEREGHIQRTVDRQDRRAKRVVVTQSGRDVLHSAHDRATASVDRLFEPLSYGEAKGFIESAAKIVAFHERPDSKQTAANHKARATET